MLRKEKGKVMHYIYLILIIILAICLPSFKDEHYQTALIILMSLINTLVIMAYISFKTKGEK